MTARQWIDGGVPALSASNLNGIEADLQNSPVPAGAYSAKTASYTLTTADKFVSFNGAALTATLPDPTTVSGCSLIVKNINASPLSVVSAGTSKTIDGAASLTLQQWKVLKVYSDGTQWLAIGDRSATAPFARVDASNVNSATSATATVTVPASAQVGDLLVIFVGSNYALNGSPPSGWTQLSWTNQSWHNALAIAKVCASGDAGATVSVNLSGTEYWDAWCVVVSGANQLLGSTSVQTTAGTSLSLTMPYPLTPAAGLGLIFGSGRSTTAGRSLSSSVGTLYDSRTGDAQNCSAVWVVKGLQINNIATVTCSVSTSGLALSYVGLA